MKKIILPIVIGLLIISLFGLGRWLFFYTGGYEAPTVDMPRLKDITVPAPVVAEFPQIPEKRSGTLLLDLSHDNNFALWELNVLLSQVSSRGFAVELLEETASMEEKLRFADSLVVVSPGVSFSQKETGWIKEFVDKGGKLLLVEDPTRRPRVFGNLAGGVPINSLATEFGLIFENDYLYNMKENDGNYRHVFFDNFRDNEITKNLKRIALYSAGSITPPGWGTVFTDDNTFSSIIETEGRLSPAVLSPDSKVLAIGDLTFMVEPFNAGWDNNQFISNIADWLTISQRVFVLSDFPHFFKDVIQLTYADAALLDMGVDLRNFLVDAGKHPELGQYEPTVVKDMLFIGLLEDAPEVKEYLEMANISITVPEDPAPTIEIDLEDEPEVKEYPEMANNSITVPEDPAPTIEIEGIGEVYQEGTSIIYLWQNDGRYLLIILADTEEAMEKTIELLKSGKFRQSLVADWLAICRIPVEEPPQ